MLFDDRFYSMRGQANKGAEGFERYTSMVGTVTTPPPPQPLDILLLAHFDNSVIDEATGVSCYAQTGYPTQNPVYDSNGLFSESLAEYGSQDRPNYLRNDYTPDIRQIINGDHQDITVSCSCYFDKQSVDSLGDVTGLTYDYVIGPAGYGDYSIAGLRPTTTVYSPRPGQPDPIYYITGIIYRLPIANNVPANTRSVEFAERLEIPLNTWLRYAFHITSTTVSLYVDGTKLGELDISGMWSGEMQQSERKGWAVPFSTKADELLICNGLGGITPPTEPYSLPPTNNSN